MKRLIDKDPFTGIETWHEYDHAEKKTVIHYISTRDLDPALDYCKALANDTDLTRKGIKQDWWHYGFVPSSVQLKWFVEEGVPFTDAEGYNKRLNRPEYKYLKTTVKHHGPSDKLIFVAK